MPLSDRKTLDTYTHAGITMKMVEETLSDQSLVYDIEVTSVDSGDIPVIFPCVDEKRATGLWTVLKGNIKESCG